MRCRLGCTWTTLTVGLMCSTTANAQPETKKALLQKIEKEKENETFYKAFFPSVEMARKAAISFHDKIVEANYSRGYLILELTPQDMKDLAKFGFRFEKATKFMAERKEFLTGLQAHYAQQSTLADIGIASIPGYSCYETVEETFAAAAAMATNHPTLASWIDVGDSWEKTQGLGGYDIRVLRLTNAQVTGSKPILFIQSAIHAREYTTAPLNLAFANWLVDGYGTDADATWILDHHEVHLMLQSNPDGRKRAETGLSWRKNTNQNHCGPTSNSRGVDLNRNFTFYWNITNGQGSSGNACSSTFRGPSPASEPEVQAIEAYVRSLWPDRRGNGQNDAAPDDVSGIHLDIHSYSQLVLWPYGHTSQSAPNGTQLQTLGRKFAFFNGYSPQQSIGLYPTDGTSDSISYGELGVPGYTFELGTSFFQSCSVFQNNILPGNLPALIYAAKVVRAPYVIPGGPDVVFSLSGNASSGGVAAGTAVTVGGSATDTQFNNSNGTEPTQNITAAEYYIDTPPWASGATAFSLSATDGNFNSSTESITGTIDTTNLAEGRYLVFVRARDADNVWGPVSAQFLVIDNTPPPPDPCLYTARFESGSEGWTGGNSSCSTGTFIQGAPTQFSSGTTITQVGGAAEGIGAWFTATNTAIGTNDVDGGSCETLSPLVNASGEQSIEVSLDYFHGQRDAGDDSTDGFTIEVLNDGTVVDTLVNIGDVTNSASWSTVSTIIGNPGNIQLRVRATDGTNGGDIVEAGIDNVRICTTSEPPPPPPPVCAVEEGFESGLGGWTNEASSTCSTGTFVAAAPTLQSNGGVTTQVGGANGGSNALFTATNSSAGTNDVDGGACAARSPTYLVTEASTLSVAYFHGQRDAGDDAGDFFRLEVSTDGGNTFTPLASAGDVTSNAAWQTASTSIPAGSNVVVRVECADGAATGDLVECGVDDISICPNP